MLLTFYNKHVIINYLIVENFGVKNWQIAAQNILAENISGLAGLHSNQLGWQMWWVSCELPKLCIVCYIAMVTLLP